MEGSQAPALPNTGGGWGWVEGAAPPLLQNMGEDLSASLLIGCLGIALALQKRAVVGVAAQPPLHPICKNMAEVQNL